MMFCSSDDTDSTHGVVPASDLGGSTDSLLTDISTSSTSLSTAMQKKRYLQHSLLECLIITHKYNNISVKL